MGRMQNSIDAPLHQIFQSAQAGRFQTFVQCGGFLVFLFAIAFPVVAHAQDRAQERVQVRNAPQNAMMAYRSGDGSIGFTVEQAGGRVVMRFAGNQGREIILRSRPATRGDLVMQDERGSVVLRVTSFGPATYFPEGNLRGIPMLQAPNKGLGETKKVMQQVAGNEAIEDVRLEAASLAAKVSQSLGASILFDLDMPPMPRTGTRTIGEAVRNVANALENLAKEPKSRDDLSDTLNRVRFTKEEQPGLHREGRILYVNIADAFGHEGRPASTSIMSFLRTPD